LQLSKKCPPRAPKLVINHRAAPSPRGQELLGCGELHVAVHQAPERGKQHRAVCVQRACRRTRYAGSYARSRAPSCNMRGTSFHPGGEVMVDSGSKGCNSTRKYRVFNHLILEIYRNAALSGSLAAPCTATTRPLAKLEFRSRQSSQ
jgi:hypothetical protein